jgi:hypothetical protein
MSQCVNIVYLPGGLTHALNDVLHGAERERLGLPDRTAKHAIPPHVCFGSMLSKNAWRSSLCWGAFSANARLGVAA